MFIRHIGIVCQNIEETKKFYQDAGFQPIYDEVEEVRIIKLEDSQGSIIELLKYESMSVNVLRQKGISHIAFTQDPEGNMLEVVTEDNAKRIS